MSSLLPWLTVAGLGALHGLNPATGWLLAAARGVQSRDSRQALRALVPIAAGHMASVALVAAAVALGLVTDRAMLRWIAAGLFVGLLAHYLWRRVGSRPRKPGGQAALMLWSFMMSTAHGAGLMLVPALIPLCLSDTPAREITASGSITLALAAVGLHTAAMLTVTGVIAAVACRCTYRPRTELC
jgi:cytochrome bd-type quinol oxidase subunit 2